MSKQFAKNCESDEYKYIVKYIEKKRGSSRQLFQELESDGHKISERTVATRFKQIKNKLLSSRSVIDKNHDPNTSVFVINKFNVDIIGCKIKVNKILNSPSRRSAGNAFFKSHGFPSDFFEVSGKVLLEKEGCIKFRAIYDLERKSNVCSKKFRVNLHHVNCKVTLFYDVINKAMVTKILRKTSGNFSKSSSLYLQFLNDIRRFCSINKIDYLKRITKDSFPAEKEFLKSISNRNLITNSNTYKWLFNSLSYQKEKELTYKPWNFNPMKGRTFNFSLYKYLEEFKLRSIDIDYINITPSTILEPIIVTAFSQNHFIESLGLFKSIRKYLPDTKIIVYDLGLDEEIITKVKTICNVKYRKFNFDIYPSHETLRDFKAIWYADTSVRFKSSDLSRIYSLVTCHSRHPSYNRSLGRSKRNPKNDNQKNSELFDWKLNVEHCQKSSYLLHSFTGHGILPATHSGVFKYLPSNLTLIGTEKNEMYEAGFVFAVKTKDIVDKVLKWYLLCSLEKDCISPPNSRLTPCKLKNAGYDKISYDCHRYDQSVVNVLLSNVNNFDSSNYISQLTNFFEIKRERKNEWSLDLKCSVDNSSQIDV
uniref:HTH_21 domain-containing protein n=1 Tax=Strongyloides venezuelensis TaxID=75913 RepID=A0A0K0EXC1_STRVS